MGRRGSRRHGRPVDGILLLDKAMGPSSNQALQQVKRIFKAAKAGHTGNLDPMASGLLPICLGQATKVSQYLLDSDKRYLAEFTFGAVTTTGDAEGEIIERRPTDDLCEQQLTDAMAQFVGEIEQVPPMYSALKHKGQPLYKLAQQGIEVERDRRRITIFDFRLLGFGEATATVDIACSKGTYVRTLAEDLGRELGCGAFVSGLRRVKSGPFEIGDALTIQQLEALADKGDLAAVDGRLLGIDSALMHLPRYVLTADSERSLIHGQTVRCAQVGFHGDVRLYDCMGSFVGIGDARADGHIGPRRLMRQQLHEQGMQTPIKIA
ncbi:MAG: tRNA pseudouridine(55) synthase TruB [Gammaproteobacteria bacterium]